MNLNKGSINVCISLKLYICKKVYILKHFCQLIYKHKNTKLNWKFFREKRRNKGILKKATTHGIFKI